MKTEIYTVHAQNADISFIMKDVFNENNDLVSTECVGFYFGEPNDDATATFTGKLKAEF